MIKLMDFPAEQSLISLKEIFPEQEWLIHFSTASQETSGL